MDITTKLLSWRWGPSGKLGLGAFLGLVVIVLPSVICMGLDMLKVTRQVEPPYFFGDFVPTHHQVCASAEEFRVQINKDTLELNELGWPAWPAEDELVVVDCGTSHLPAPVGHARWHLCTDLREEGGEVGPGCTAKSKDEAPPGGIARAQIVDGKIVAVDMYISGDAAVPKDIVVIHEELHGRGLLIEDEDDEKTKYVEGAHTEKPGHVMTESPSGKGMKWLDRRPGGDWPYGSAEEDIKEGPDPKASSILKDSPEKSPAAQ